MAVGLEPWIYILRGYCGSAVLATIFVAAPILSSFGVADAKSYKHPSGFRPLLVSLFLLYLGDIVVLVIEAQSRGELPDATASISISIFALTSAVQLEKLATLEKVKFSVSCIYLGSWVLLSTVEFFTIIWLWSRPSSALFPYLQFGIVFTAVELLAYIALSFLFYHACCERYESLTQSDIENGDAASESTGYDGDDDESESDSNDYKADPLGIRMEVRKEVGELGGWWPFIKKFRIFLKFMWPFGNALLQLRFILTLFFVMAGRFISVYKPLQTALLLDALASGADPWRPLAVVITINVADTVFSFVVKLLWIDVSLHRAKKLEVEVQSQIMSLDFSFHSQAQPTDVIKAVDNAGSVDTLLDSFIFQFGTNLVTLIVAIVQLFHRYGLYVILICTHTAAYYCIVEKRYVTVATAEHDKCNTLRDKQERRRQDSVRGWSTVSNHNRVKYETGLFSSAVGSWMSQWR
ncbi:ABC transporter type 1, transmembrane domain-containing protein, partial [Diplogelasinospora grovesii]